ncbi:MAG: tetratricopeptide repeat protein [Deltaproteobacteria bacterium]|nr:tetratricopeptide repeat protein [Deltaproteobacteria bacterium]
MSRRVITLIMGIAMLSQPVRAQSLVSAARTHFASGRSYYQTGRYKDAIREFQAAYELSKNPDLLFNIAQCWERLGNLTNAIKYRQAYLDESGHPTDEAEVKLQIAALKQRIASTAVKVQGLDVGAVLLVDGKQVAKGPVAGPVHVVPGSHRITARRPGFADFHVLVAVTPGQQVAIRIVWNPLRSKAAGSNGSTSKSSHRSKRLWTWVTLGTGAGLLLAGLGLGVGALSAVRKANDRGDRGDLGGYDRYKKRAKGLAAAADVSYALGGALVVTGIVLYFFEPRWTHHEKQTAIVPYIGPKGAGLSATLSF